LLQPNEECNLKLSSKAIKDISFQLKDNHPIILDVTATHPFEFCPLNEHRECASSFQKYKKRESEIRLDASEVKYGARVSNPSQLWRAKLRVRFHLVEEQCHKLEPLVLHHKELSHSNCFQFELRPEDAELLLVKESFMALEYTIRLCGKTLLVEEGELGEYFVPAALAGEQCEEEPRVLTVEVLSRDNGSRSTQTEKGSNALLMIALQYFSQPTSLPDGLAYTCSVDAWKNRCKLFEYEMINLRSTTINVVSQAEVEIYVKVVEEEHRHSVVPGPDKHDFSSQAGTFLTYFKPFLLITQEQLLPFGCRACFLLVGLYLKDGGGQLSIEVSQGVAVLLNGEVKHSFLPGGSRAYYQYSPKLDTPVLYQLADDNLDCAALYLSDS
jgi:hypothetical protein